MSQEPLPVIKIRDHMTEKNVVCPLSTEENAQSGDVMQNGTLDYTGWIDEERGELILDRVLEILEGCVVR